MEGVELLKWLGSLGATGVAVFLYLKFSEQLASRDKLYLDRLDRIENRHFEEERLDREQAKQLFEQIRLLFDRVMTICIDLSGAVKGLRESTDANKRAIDELREEFRSQRPSAPR